VSCLIPEAISTVIIDLTLINEIGTINIVIDINGIVNFSKYHTIPLRLGHLKNKACLGQKNVNFAIMLDQFLTIGRK
jgi:hypothetical protein